MPNPEPNARAAGARPAPPGHEAPSTRGERESIYRYAGIVTSFTLLSRILGLARDLAISNRFGAGGVTDAWVQAFRIPNALRRLTAEGSMTIAFVPVYVELREREGGAAARHFARQVLGLVLVATGVLCAAGMIFSDAVTLLVSPGFADEPEKFALTSRFVRWTFPHLLLVSLVAWAMGILNSEKRFAAPAAAPVVFNLGIVGMVFLAADGLANPAMAIAYGAVIGGLLQVFLQLPSLTGAGAPLAPSFRWRSGAMPRFFALMGPALFGVAVYQINIIVLGVLSSYLPTGQVFHYNNATRLSEFVMGLFTFAFTTAGLPALSGHYARRDWPAMGQTLNFTFAAVLFTTAPAMTGLIAAAEPIVSMLYRHGAFSPADVAVTADTLKYMALGMPAVAVVRVLVPMFYALGDSRTPVWASAASVAVTGVLGWALSGPMQVAGLALGLALGTWFQALTLAAALRGRVDNLGSWFPWGEVRKQALACAAMGLSVGLLARLGHWERGPASLSNWLIFIPLIAGGAGVYGGLALLLGDQQARHWQELMGRAARKLGRLAARPSRG